MRRWRSARPGSRSGTAFAYCDESGLTRDIKDQVLAMSRAGLATVFTDPVASPTGFPFKVLTMDGTLSDADAYAQRTRICDLGYLRHAYTKDNGAIGWRCPSEPVADYLRKGGKLEDTVGRKCVCNGLMANIGLGQVQKQDVLEKPLITSGDDVATVARFPPARRRFVHRPGRDRLPAGERSAVRTGDAAHHHRRVMTAG
jgi:nitronate monooxygenase